MNGPENMLVAVVPEEKYAPAVVDALTCPIHDITPPVAPLDNAAAVVPAVTIPVWFITPKLLELAIHAALLALEFRLPTTLTTPAKLSIP